MVKFNNAVRYGNTAGKAIALYNLMFIVVFSLIFLFMGYMMRISHNSKLTESTSAEVISSDCEYKEFESENINKNNGSQKKLSMYECGNVEYSYRVDDDVYIGYTQTNSSVEYNPGKIIDIVYNPENPGESELKKISPKLIGNIFIIIALLLFFGGLIRTYFVFKVKGAGSAYAVGNAYSYFTND